LASRKSPRSTCRLKVGWEVLATPLTVCVVGWLKKKKGVDCYDTDTNFTRFSLKV
jgi:queuosine precursor transporter